MSADSGASLPPTYFEALYAADPDPWRFASSEYEAAKYAATLGALPRQRYRSAFEIGCSIGVLTQGLAGRCDRLLAVDVSERALRQARERCRHMPRVRFAVMQVPQTLPRQRFDLVVLSEVGYYLSIADLQRLKQALGALLQTGGHLILVHWTHEVADYPLSGDEVHELFLKSDGAFESLGGWFTGDYRLDRLQRL